ncbi:imm11 family protein [Microbulbifer sp. ZKSA002]|uniref:imm11 family protein n=1 Tax=Microbulbifer sp. ZKSA002 TaxID=3243388 RepID=UPI00403986F7
MKIIKDMELFCLRVIVDDPRFEGFGLENIDEPSVLGRNDLLEDITPGYEVTANESDWNPVVLKDKWLAPKVEGRVSSFQDYPGLDFIYPAFSERACTVLQDLLEPYGELLPLDAVNGKYYFYNILSVQDALNRNLSRCKYWCDPPTSAIDIDYFAFDKDRLLDIPIFRIYDLPEMVIVSGKFVNRVMENDLKGFSFTKIWPLSPNIDWHDQKPMNLKGLESNELLNLKRQTLIVMVTLSDEMLDIEKSEMVSAIQDEIDSHLMLLDVESNYFGSLEGVDVINSQARFFLSCPDSEKLLRNLLPLLKMAKWGEVDVVLSQGYMHDSNAPQKRLSMNDL